MTRLEYLTMRPKLTWRQRRYFDRMKRVSVLDRLFFWLWTRLID